MKRIATCTDQRSIVPETDALLFATCDQAFFNSLLKHFQAKGLRNEGHSIYVYFDNDQKSAAPLDAARLMRLMHLKADV